MSIQSHITNAGLTIPELTVPAANYAPYAAHQGTLILSGQLPLAAGEMRYQGKVGQDVKLEDAQAAARLCALNLLGAIQHAVEGEWNRLGRMLRIGVFVNAESGFTDAHLVANGASDLLVEALGEAGKHARAAVCVSELPLGAAVEVDGLAATL